VSGDWQIHVRVILFDLDGVLVDSTAEVARAWRAWADQHGFVADEVEAIAHGQRSVDVIRALAPHLDADEETRRLETPAAAGAGGAPALPGARRLLTTLPVDRWAVVTSGSRPLARSRLASAGLPEPAVLVTADDVSRGKPDPEPYERASAALGVHPAAALVVEDSPSGLAAARAAGMPSVALTTTYPADQLTAAQVIVNSLDDLVIEPAADGWLRVGGATGA
jgi:mannitol-1-/sugar-/sorbitol-6-phosphatase